MNLTGKQKRDYEKLLELQTRAMHNPNQLVKMSAGNYFFYDKENDELLTVSDDGHENGGKPCWVVRQVDNNDNYVNDYPTLKAFKEDWIR